MLCSVTVRVVSVCLCCVRVLCLSACVLEYVVFCAFLYCVGLCCVRVLRLCACVCASMLCSVRACACLCCVFTVLCYVSACVVCVCCGNGGISCPAPYNFRLCKEWGQVGMDKTRYAGCHQIKIPIVTFM